MPVCLVFEGWGRTRERVEVSFFRERDRSIQRNVSALLQDGSWTGVSTVYVHACSYTLHSGPFSEHVGCHESFRRSPSGAEPHGAWGAGKVAATGSCPALHAALQSANAADCAQTCWLTMMANHGRLRRWSIGRHSSCPLPSNGRPTRGASVPLVHLCGGFLEASAFTTSQPPLQPGCPCPHYLRKAPRGVTEDSRVCAQVPLGGNS